MLLCSLKISCHFDCIVFLNVDYLPLMTNALTLSYQNQRIMAQYIIHTADSRGYADHGWLKANHTFSFAGYFNPERVHFGALRVLNDDLIAPARGFGEHPHENM